MLYSGISPWGEGKNHLLGDRLLSWWISCSSSLSLLSDWLLPPATSRSKPASASSCCSLLESLWNKEDITLHLYLSFVYLSSSMNSWRRLKLAVPVSCEHDVVLMKLLSAEVLPWAPVLITVHAARLLSTNGGVKSTTTFWPGIKTWRQRENLHAGIQCPHLAYILMQNQSLSSCLCLSYNTVKHRFHWNIKMRQSCISPQCSLSLILHPHVVFLWHNRHREEQIVKWSHGNIPNVGLIVACPAPGRRSGRSHRRIIWNKRARDEGDERLHAMTKYQSTQNKTLKKVLGVMGEAVLLVSFQMLPLEFSH